MKLIYHAEDDTMFESKEDCMQYESLVNFYNQLPKVNNFVFIQDKQTFEKYQKYINIVLKREINRPSIIAIKNYPLWIKTDRYNSCVVFNEFDISYIKEMARIYNEYVEAEK